MAMAERTAGAEPAQGDIAGAAQRAAVDSVLMLLCPKTASKGTGFLLDCGLVITTEHVVEGLRPRDIVGVDRLGNHVPFRRVFIDADRDLAALRPTHRPVGGLSLSEQDAPEPGRAVTTWGFPLGHFGTEPLLSVGYVAGASAVRTRRRHVRQLVVNGAFNAGNSGGPLFLAGGDRVIGVVVSKHVPLSPFVGSAIDALAANPSGQTYVAQDASGRKRKYVESQLIAEVFQYLHGLAQVMIGQAVCASEIRQFVRNVERRERRRR